MQRSSGENAGRFPSVYRGSFGSQRARTAKKAPLNTLNSGHTRNEDNNGSLSSPEKSHAEELPRSFLVPLRKSFMAWIRLRPWLRYEYRNLRVLYSALGKREKRIMILCWRTLAKLRRSGQRRMIEQDLAHGLGRRGRLQSSFCSWIRFVLDARQKQQIAQSIQIRSLMRNGNQEVAISVVQQASGHLLSLHFYAWIGLIRRNNKLVRTVLDLATRTTLALCSRCFRLWVVAFFDWVRLRELVAELIERVMLRWSSLAFARWVEWVESEKQLLDTGTRIVVRWCGHLLLQSFRGWVSVLRTRKRAKELREDAIETWGWNLASITVKRLQTNVQERKMGLEKMAIAFGTSPVCLKQWAVETWRATLVDGHLDSVTAWLFRSLDNIWIRKRQQVVWTLWSDITHNANTRRSKRKQVEKLVSLHLYELMWQAWVTFSEKQSRLFESATQVLEMYDTAVQRRHLHMWRSVAHDTQRLKYATVHVMDAALTTTAGRAFMDWKWYVRSWNRIYHRARKMARKYFLAEGVLLMQEWRWVVLRRKRMEVKLRDAISRYAAFRVPPAFFEWKRRVHLRERTFTICENNRRRAKERLALSTFEDWQFGFRVRRKLDILYGRLANRLCERQLLCIIVAWHSWACKFFTTASKLLAKHKLRERQTVFAAFRRYAFTRSAGRNRAASVAVRGLLKVMQKWQSRMAYLAHLQNMFYQAVLDSTQNTQYKVMRTWLLQCQTERLHRRAERNADRYWRNLLKDAVIAWSMKSRAYQHLVRTERKAKSKHLVSLKCRYLMDWRTMAVEAVRLRSTEGRLEMKVSAQVLASSFFGWAARAWKSSRVKQLMLEVVSGREESALVWAMDVWMEDTRRSKHARLKRVEGELGQCMGQLVVLSEQLALQEAAGLEFQAQRGELEAEVFKSRESEAVAMKVVELMRTTEEGANGRIHDLLARVGDANHMYQRLEAAQESARVLEGRRKELVAHVQLLERELDKAKFEQNKMQMDLESAWTAMEARRDEVGKEAVDGALKAKELEKVNAELQAKVELQSGELEALVAKTHKVTVAQAQAEAARNVAQRAERTLREEVDTLSAELRTKEESQRQMLTRMKELEEALDGQRKGMRGLVTLVDGDAKLLEENEKFDSLTPKPAVSRLSSKPLETEVFQAEVAGAQDKLKAVMDRVRDLEARDLNLSEELHQMRVKMAEKDESLRAEGLVIADLRLLLKETRAAHAGLEVKECAQRKTLEGLKALLRTVVAEARDAEFEVSGLGDSILTFMEREQELRAEGEAAGRERGEQYYKLLLKAEAALAEQTAFVDEAEQTRRLAEEEAAKLRRELEAEKIAQSEDTTSLRKELEAEKIAHLEDTTNLRRELEAERIARSEDTASLRRELEAERIARTEDSASVSKLDEGREELVEIYRRQAEEMAREQQRLLDEVERLRESGRVRAELENRERGVLNEVIHEEVLRHSQMSPVPGLSSEDRKEALSDFCADKFDPFLQRRLTQGCLDHSFHTWFVTWRASAVTRAVSPASPFQRPPGASPASWPLQSSYAAPAPQLPQPPQAGSPHTKPVPVRSGGRLDMQPTTPAPSPLPASEATSEGPSPRTGQLSHRSREGSEPGHSRVQFSSLVPPPPPPRITAGQSSEESEEEPVTGGPGQFPEWWMHSEPKVDDPEEARAIAESQRIAAEEAKAIIETQRRAAEERAKLLAAQQAENLFAGTAIGPDEGAVLFAGAGAERGDGAETQESAEEGHRAPHPEGEEEESRTWTRAPVDSRPGFIGMSITKETPHVVLAVEDVVDENMRRQGEPGYSNPEVSPGDILRAVAGVDVMTASAGLLSDHIAGQSNSSVTLLLSRPSGEQYQVKVMRHTPGSSPAHGTPRHGTPRHGTPRLGGVGGLLAATSPLASPTSTPEVQRPSLMDGVTHWT